MARPSKLTSPVAALPRAPQATNRRRAAAHSASRSATCAPNAEKPPWSTRKAAASVMPVGLVNVDWVGRFDGGEG